jgi:hypothetical protein
MLRPRHLISCFSPDGARLGLHVRLDERQPAQFLVHLLDVSLILAEIRRNEVLLLLESCNLRVELLFRFFSLRLHLDLPHIGCERCKEIV